MPVKRRVIKGRRQLPDLLQRIVDGKPVAYSREGHTLLVGVKYFNDFEDLPAEARQRVNELVSEWSELCR
jgi:hypothetical protein